jgi:hypothetical protein
MTMLTRRAILMAALETTYGVNPGLSLLTDGVLVEAPDFTADETILMRDYTHADLSPLSHIVGRKLAKVSFTTEMRGNDLENSGLVANAPVIARLFEACGYALSGNAAMSATPVYDINDQPAPVVWGAPNVAAATFTDTIMYLLSVSTPGASGTAQVTISSPITGESGAEPVTLTSGSPVPVGTHGVTVTPTFSGQLEDGQSWVFWALPAGLQLAPISDNFASLSMEVFYDGTMHQLNGCLGTFSINATAGQYAKIKWDFTGQYVPTVDAALPSPSFELTLPAMVELAELAVNPSFMAGVEAFTWTQGNDIQPRPDVNQTDGYNGVRIVSRKPEIGIDPEAQLVATNDFWGQLSTAQRMPFQMRIGSTPGNEIWILAPCTQYSKLTYKDRQGLRTYDAGLAPSRVYGNDEVLFVLA